MSRRRLRAGFRHASLLGLAGLLLCCDSAPPLPAPEVEYSGCWAVYLPGPVCTLHPTRELKFWVKIDPGTKVEVRAGGQHLKTAGEESGNGRRYKLSIPHRVSKLTVQLSLPDGRRSPVWALRLVEPEVPAWQAEIVELQSNGKSKELSALLAQLRKVAPPKEQGLILWMLADRALLDGDDDKAAEYLEQGIAADRAENRLNREVEKVGRLTRLYLDHGRFSNARRTLATLRLPSEAPANSKYLEAYYQGLLADRVGDYRSALQQLRNAADLAERVGMSSYRCQAEQVLARLYQDVGLSQKALELFERLRTVPESDFEKPCDKGSLLTNWAWSRLRARESGEEGEDPTPLFEKARAIFDDNDCARPDQRLNARLNLAFAHLQAGRTRKAQAALDEARPLEADASLRERLWWPDLEGRLALDRGNPKRALELYTELEQTARDASSSEARFRALLGQADTLLALGQRAAALAVLAKADRSIDEQSWQIPVHEGRDAFVAKREATTRLYVELLLEGGQRQSAFSLARRARSRLLRQLEMQTRLTQDLSRYWTSRDAMDRQAAEEWKLPGDQLKRARESLKREHAHALAALDCTLAERRDRDASGKGDPSPLHSGEVILAYHPLPHGWVGFAADERGIEVSRFELPAPANTDPEVLAQKLLEPFRPAIERAERVRVLPYGRLWSVDFHALPFGGEPLLARHVVVYGLDLPARPLAAASGRRVLLVSDPKGNLPAAREEATVVAAVIPAWGSGWSLTRLDGSAAQAAAVRKALPGTGLFHYAGHGTFAGFGGWDSGLELADGSRLTLGDLLALRRMPAWVVLSSCEGARSSEQAPGEGIGLAHAFLLAGAQAVVAATRPVTDRVGRDLVRELYRGWKPGVDLSRQLRQAQLACRRRDPAADWASFRLFEP
jgi:tetratricopeptide (TPR) repeat protein